MEKEKFYLKEFYLGSHQVSVTWCRGYDESDSGASWSREEYEKHKKENNLTHLEAIADFIHAKNLDN